LIIFDHGDNDDDYNGDGEYWYKTCNDEDVVDGCFRLFNCVLMIL